jgi:signal transduction histidine kinase
MEIAHDFAASPPPPDAWRDGMLACCQHFLGHDLPNRLVAAQGFARDLAAQRADRLDDDGRALLVRVADLILEADVAARRLAEVGRLLRDGELADPYDLDDLLREAVAEARPGTVQYRLPDSLPRVLAPPRLARHALAELLRNAADAGGPVAVGAAAEGGRVACQIGDAGRGLTEEQLRRLAAYFAGGPPPGPGPGLFLLFLVREAVASWGGAVRVRSEPGRGATFTLVFRAADPG